MLKMSILIVKTHNLESPLDIKRTIYLFLYRTRKINSRPPKSKKLFSTSVIWLYRTWFIMESPWVWLLFFLIPHSRLPLRQLATSLATARPFRDCSSISRPLLQPATNDFFIVPIKVKVEQRTKIHWVWYYPARCRLDCPKAFYWCPVQFCKQYQGAILAWALQNYRINDGFSKAVLPNYFQPTWPYTTNLFPNWFDLS